MSEPSHDLELTTHAVGAQSEALAALTAQRPPNRDNCVAAWTTEYGPLNRIVTLSRRHGNASQSTALDGRFDWLDGSRLRYPLIERRSLRSDLLSAPLQELRMYATRPGLCESFISALTAALPYREQYSPCVAVWTTRERGWDIAVHLWAYDSFDARIRARRAAASDHNWSAYRNRLPSLLQYMQAFLLTPVQRPDVAPAGGRQQRSHEA